MEDNTKITISEGYFEVSEKIGQLKIIAPGEKMQEILYDHKV
jgi:hypothetical protein